MSHAELSGVSDEHRGRRPTVPVDPPSPGIFAGGPYGVLATLGVRSTEACERARVTGNTRSAQLAPAYAAPRARSQASVDLSACARRTRSFSTSRPAYSTSRGQRHGSTLDRQREGGCVGMRSRGPLGRSTVLVAVMMLMTALTAATASAATPAPAAARATNLCQTAVDRTDATVGPTAGQTTVQGLRVGQHEDATPRYDRGVVDLASPLRNYQVRYVPQVIADGSGEPVNLRGSAFLYVRLDAIAHDDNGHGTITGSTDQVVNWGSLREARLVGDFEGVVTFGIGLRASTDFVVSTLTN